MSDQIIVEEKVRQARDIVADAEADVWLTFARETSEIDEPCLPYVLGFDVVWPTMILVTAGRSAAIIGRHDAPNAEELGVHEVYRMGGAQAVAALAYGCDRVPAVNKIVGPGNLFVALAKKHVYGTVDIDSFAGPSEVIVIADDSARPDFVAADLLAQAEHSPGSAILIT